MNDVWEEKKLLLIFFCYIFDKTKNINDETKQTRLLSRIKTLKYNE